MMFRMPVVMLVAGFITNGCSQNDEPGAPEIPVNPPSNQLDDESRTDSRTVRRPAIEALNQRWSDRIELPQDGRIVGGDPTTPDEFPWAVALLYEKTPNDWRQYCGGTLIGAEWVITAAHCDVYLSDRVVIGRHNLADKSQGRAHEIEWVFNNENYGSLSKYDSDIALIKLKHASDVGPISLLQTNDSTEVGGVATVVGWGHTSAGGFSSDKLRKVDVLFVGEETCKDNYSSRGSVITENMICAGEDGKDSCQGDSGGALLVFDTDDGISFSYRLAGVVSFGIGCALPQFPGVYTRVPNFLTWIEDAKRRPH